jgi:GNAT superfamily N-acetyltransferase
MQITPAISQEDLATVRTLFEEYWQSFGFTPCFQGFAEELEGLPGKYAPPGGVLGILRIDGVPAGCVALRPLDAGRAEFKRLYVRSAFRGQGLGRVLLEWIVAQARALNYRELLADTMPQMSAALAMYDGYGFERTGPYGSDPTPGAVYLRLVL